MKIIAYNIQMILNLQLVITMANQLIITFYRQYSLSKRWLPVSGKRG